MGDLERSEVQALRRDAEIDHASDAWDLSGEDGPGYETTVTDIDAFLAEMLEFAECVTEVGAAEAPLNADVLAAGFKNLHRWMSSGKPLPTQWQR